MAGFDCGRMGRVRIVPRKFEALIYIKQAVLRRVVRNVYNLFLFGEVAEVGTSCHMLKK